MCVYKRESLNKCSIVSCLVCVPNDNGAESFIVLKHVSHNTLLVFVQFLGTLSNFYENESGA